MTEKRVAIIGGGVAGMQMAIHLKERGANPVIIEREPTLGGKVAGWYVLFPTFTPAEQVVAPLKQRIAELGIEVMLDTTVTAIAPTCVTLQHGQLLRCDAVALCSGSTLFDARIKEEYGYGIYDNVYTSADLEQMMREGEVRMANGERPERIAILHCVGSRDEKVCQRHCSKVCCVTGVKQAIELKRMMPQAEVFNFYMDIRMFGPGYEEMYREAQVAHNVHFVRGRISEASPLSEGRLQIKAEDTLTGRPLRMSVDMLVLLIGMRGNDDNLPLATSAGITLAENGFFHPRNHFLDNVESERKGIFMAGTCSSPKSIGETLCEATTAAERIINYLNRSNKA
ncbi:MAG: CoB--CoM heterodisulfide reductase iron-sulfur subunit A family protein [Alistipes sp.]|nr:CoB--CoM heterodisulfide reductase iron-sulfur subunit A family protein [Alistipes sp.]